MKKILFFGGLLLSAMTFVACDEDYDDWASPQSNPQEESVTLPGYSASEVSAIDLASVEGETVKVLDLASVTLPEGATVGNTRVILTPADDESASPTTLNVDENGCASVADLQSAIEFYYGRGQTARTFNGQVYSNIIIDGQTFLVDAGTIQITATPIPSTYYLVGALQDWSAVDMTCAMYPTSTTVQSYTTQWNDAGNLKIWDAANFGSWDVAYGAQTNDDNSPSGVLVNNNAGAIVVPTIGEYYTLTCDFGTMTYTWTRLENQTPKEYSTIGLIGDFNGWGDDVDMTMVAPHNWYLQTTIETDGGLKFRANDDWADNWGEANNITDRNYGTGVSNGNNITVPAGTYSVYFNDITGQYLFVAE